jgi:hypothetical protein
MRAGLRRARSVGHLLLQAAAEQGVLLAISTRENVGEVTIPSH